MALTPTLFVGLGSSGSRILRKLREYIHATYLTRDLPIFQFLVIETADEEGERVIDRSWRFFACDSPNFKTVNEKDPSFDWLQVSEKLKQHAFDKGAGNVRAAGRLGLRQNWIEPEGEAAPRKKIKTLIDESYEAMRRENNSDAIKYLEEYYTERRNMAKDQVPVPIVDDGSRVFVVGTFCGGTASGMLWDVCYYLRHKVYGDAMEGEERRLQGIFTIPDVLFANQRGANRDQHAANTWAALLELDYLSRASTEYKALFPRQATPFVTTAPPFDHFLIASPSGIRGRIAAKDDDAVTALNESVALYLFCQTVDKFKGALQSERVNWPLDNGYHPISKRLRFLSTFGLSGVLFPKYNIAAAAACLLGKQICNKWRQAPERMNESSIEEYAAAQWSRLTAEMFDADAGAANTLEEARDRVKEDTNRLNFGRSTWATELESSVEEFLKRGGTWRRRLESRVRDWQVSLGKRSGKLAASAFSHHDNLPQTDKFFEALLQKISIDLRNPERFPTEEPEIPSLTPLLRPVAEANSSVWVKLTGKQQSAISFHRTRGLALYRKKLERYVFQLTNYLAKAAVQDLHDNILPTLRSRILNHLPQAIDEVSSALEAMRNDYSTLVTPPSVKLVTASAQGQGIENAAKQLSETLSSELLAEGTSFAEILTNRLQEFSDNEFKLFPQDQAAIEMRERFLEQCIDYLDQGGNNLAALVGGLGEEGIKAIESAAVPYLQWPGNQEPDIAGSRSLALLFGSKINNDVVMRLRRDSAMRKQVDDTVDHLALFYNEKFGFSIDDTSVRVQLEEQFKYAQSLPNQFTAGRFTHKDGLAYFDTERGERAARLLERREEVNRWATIAVDVVHEKFANASGEFPFRFKNEGITDEIDLKKPEDRQRLASVDSTGLETLISKVKQALTEIGPAEAQKRADQLTERLLDAGQKGDAAAKGALYRTLFKEVFPAEAKAAS